MPLYRRARNRDGSSIAPVTLSHMREMGLRRIHATCRTIGCEHEGEIEAEGLPGELPVPDVGLRLRCAVCGARHQAESRPDWRGFTAPGRR